MLKLKPISFTLAYLSPIQFEYVKQTQTHNYTKYPPRLLHNKHDKLTAVTAPHC